MGSLTSGSSITFIENVSKVLEVNAATGVVEEIEYERITLFVPGLISPSGDQLKLPVSPPTPKDVFRWHQKN